MAAPATGNTATTNGYYSGSPYDMAATMPSSLSNGDVVVCFVLLPKTPGTTIDSAPGGWDLLKTMSSGNGVLYCYTHDVTDAGSEPGSYTWSFGAATRATALAIQVSGGDYGTDGDSINVSADQTGPGSGDATSPDVTVDEADSLILRMAADMYTGAADFTKPASETLTVDFEAHYPSGSVSESTVSSDPGTETFTYTPTWHASDDIGAITISIPPTGGAATCMPMAIHHFKMAGGL